MINRISIPNCRKTLVLFMKSVLSTLVTVCSLILASCGLLKPLPPIDMKIPPQSGAQVPSLNFNDPNTSPVSLMEWAKPLAKTLELEPIVLASYAFAQQWLAVHRPQCHLKWTTLAAIGRVESKNGFFRGSRVLPNGDVRPHIRGPLLDGSSGTMVIRDTDQGKYDGNAEYDRALGPLQIIPETMERFGLSPMGNNPPDPDNFPDAALTSGNYMCVQGGDLSTVSGWTKAIFAYNNSQRYFHTVVEKANGYGQGIPG